MEEKKLYTREPNGYFISQNLKFLPKEFEGVLEGIPPAQIKIDNELIIQGIKNPLMMIFIGFSTRRLIDSLRRKKKRIDNIVVIEPRLDVFKELLMTEDISDLLQDPRIDFIVGTPPSELLPELFKVFTKTDEGNFVSRVGKILNMERLVDPFSYGSIQSSPDAAQIDAIVTGTVKQVELAMGCPDDQFRRWELMVENRHNMFNAYSVKQLYGKLKDIPVVVCGGGPSLETFIETYKTSKELKNALIIAADAVLYRLLDEGIRPHIVTRCERKLTQIFKGVEKDNTEGIYYAAYPWTPPEFFELFKDHFYLYRNNGVCLFTKLEHGNVDGGVSAANAALELAFMLGCKNIILTGIDLCFVDNKSHVSGTQVEFNINSSKEKWTEILTNEGGKATSIPVWVRCLNEYAQSIDKHKSKGEVFTVYNTSSKGAKITGAEYKPLQECLCFFKDPKDVRALIEKLRVKFKEEDKKRFYAEIKKALKSLKEIKEACNITVGLEADAMRTCKGEMDKLMRKLKRDAGDDHFALIGLVRQNDPNYDKLTKNVADAWDVNFKTKYIPDLYYRMCLMDVLQHDVFIYENQINSLHNKTIYTDERYLAYSKLTRDFIDKVDYYAEKFIKLFEGAL